MTDAFTPQHCYEMWENIRSHPRCRNSRCIYAEVIRAVLTVPYISICVKNPSDDCRVGFRGVEPLRITGYHMADMGYLAVVRCGNTELWIKPGMCKKNPVAPYGGPTDIAVRIWWGCCMRIIIVSRSSTGQSYRFYCACP